MRSWRGGAFSQLLHVLERRGVVWVVVGDREKIESGIRELGFGGVRILDATGRVETPPAAARR